MFWYVLPKRKWFFQVCKRFFFSSSIWLSVFRFYSISARRVCIDNVSLSSEWHSDDGCLPIFFIFFFFKEIYSFVFMAIYTLVTRLLTVSSHKVFAFHKWNNKKKALFDRLHSPHQMTIRILFYFLHSKGFLL